MSSSKINDPVFDPFAGTGTTLVVASQLDRKSIGIEIDTKNVERIDNRLKTIRKSDSVNSIYKEYAHTPELDQIWSNNRKVR